MATSQEKSTTQPRVDVDTRQRLIDETLTTILDKGIAAVRIDEIAAAVNVTKGSLYWHFKDREALIRTALGEYLRKLSAQTIDGVSTAIADAGNRTDYLAQIAPLLVDPYNADQVNYRWNRLELLVESRKDPLLAEMLREFHVSDLNVFVELMESAQEQGILRKEIDPRAVAAIISVVNLGSTVLDVMGENSPTQEAWWNLLLFLIESLFPEAPIQ